MCKEMPVIPVGRAVDKKRIIGKKWRVKEGEKHKGLLTPKNGNLHCDRAANLFFNSFLICRVKRSEVQDLVSKATTSCPKFSTESLYIQIYIVEQFAAPQQFFNQKCSLIFYVVSKKL
jgi:hypothetical protein